MYFVVLHVTILYYYFLYLYDYDHLVVIKKIIIIIIFYPVLFLDINECASLPCQNGGQCMDSIANFTCTCVAGYEGVNCHISNSNLLNVLKNLRRKLKANNYDFKKLMHEKGIMIISRYQ